MDLLTWLKDRLILFTRKNNKSLIIEFQKQINDLKAENKNLREKIIIFPKEKDSKIKISFFDENIEKEIIKNIRTAKKEICIAVAWFTSDNIMEELNSIKNRGVDIKVIISGAKDNNRKKDKLESVCNKLKVAIIPNDSKKKYNNIMHNKYCIIDNEKVLDGSYNYSNNAKYNLEHIIIIESKKVAQLYKENFNKIYNNQRYYSNYDVIHLVS